MKKKIIALLAIISVVAFSQTSIDVSKIKDGTYTGSYKASFGLLKGDYQARVNVRGGKIESITVIKSAHSSGTTRAKKAYEKVIGSSMVDIDSITGATWKALVVDALKTK